MLACKPNLTSQVWKSIAFGAYIDLQEFFHINIKANVKYLSENTPLQVSKGGYISIWKQNIHRKFYDISEQILVFRSYIEAILILCSNRKQVLNYYHNHISTMCTKYEFSAVMSYDKDRQLEITINHDLILFDCSIIAEGEILIL